MSEVITIKQKMSAQEIAIAQGEYEKKAKSSTLMWILWLFTGGIGGHRYYLGDIGRGIAMTLTLGGLGVWTLIDAFFISKRLSEINEVVELDVLRRIATARTINN
jgi:hypothetical protein